MRTQTWRADDGGFTLVEVLVAMAVISSVLLGLVFVQMGALKTTTLAKQRQQATGLANRAMETIRALPFAELGNGMNASDISPAQDANLTPSGRFKPLYDGSIDEELVVSNAAPVAPLRPHVEEGALTTVGSLAYKVSTYVTKAGADIAKDGVWLTVVVDWSSFVSNGSKTVAVRSRAYAPTGCSAATVRAYSGPCQTFLYGQAGSTATSLQVGGAIEGDPVLTGNPATTGAVSLASVSALSQAEQTISGSATAATSGTVVVDATGPTNKGAVSAASSTSTDPATGPTTTGPASATQVFEAQSIDGSYGSLVFAPGSSDSTTVTSVPASSSSSGCADTAGDQTATSQICSSAAASPGGAASVVLDLNASSGRDLPPTTIAAVAAPTTAVSGWAARYTSPGWGHCTSAAAAGCIAAASKRSLGVSTIGAVPPTGAGPGDFAPAGYNWFLARISGLADSSSAESGASAGAPAATRSGGSLELWNGGGYSTVDLTSPAASGTYPLPEATTGYAVLGLAGVEISVSGTLTVTAPSTIPEGMAPCDVEACSWTASSGSVVADIRYVVRSAADGVVVEFDLRVDLGASLTKTTYRAVP